LEQNKDGQNGCHKPILTAPSKQPPLTKLTNIALIPKKDGTNEVNNFYPISLMSG
jgi:hypothetical protein